MSHDIFIKTLYKYKYIFIEIIGHFKVEFFYRLNFYVLFTIFAMVPTQLRTHCVFWLLSTRIFKIYIANINFHKNIYECKEVCT